MPHTVTFIAVENRGVQLAFTVVLRLFNDLQLHPAYQFVLALITADHVVKDLVLERHQSAASEVVQGQKVGVNYKLGGPGFRVQVKGERLVSFAFHHVERLVGEGKVITDDTQLPAQITAAFGHDFDVAQ